MNVARSAVEAATSPTGPVSSHSCKPGPHRGAKPAAPGFLRARSPAPNPHHMYTQSLRVRASAQNVEREGRPANRGRSEPRPYSAPGWVTADRRRGWNLCPPAARNITGKANAFKCDCGAIPSQPPGSCAAQTVTVIKEVTKRPTRQLSCAGGGLSTGNNRPMT